MSIEIEAKSTWWTEKGQWLILPVSDISWVWELWRIQEDVIVAAQSILDLYLRNNDPFRAQQSYKVTRVS